MEFVELSEGEFRKAKFPSGNFLQSVEMYQRYKGLKREAYFVGVKEKGRILASGLILARNWRLGKKIFRVAGGWLMDYDGENWREVLEFLSQEAEKFCKNRGGMVLEIAPNIVSQTRDIDNQVVAGPEHLAVKQRLVDLGYKYLGEYEQVKWIFVLNLVGKTVEDLFKGLRMTHRRLIRRAEREGVRVRELGDGELGIMKENAAEAGARHGFLDPTMEYYHSMKQYFGKKVQFMVAEAPVEEGKYVPVATGMFVWDERELVYLYGGSMTKYQKYNGSYLLQWKMIEKAVEQGAERYNFYGVRPVAGNGVYLFKQGFRGNVEELLGTFAKPLDVVGKVYAWRLRGREMGEVR